MTLQQRTLRGLVFGALGGLAAWLLIEKSGWFALLLSTDSGIVVGARTYWLQNMLGAVYGLFIAVSLALAAWRGLKPDARALRSLVFGAVAGLIGGWLGMLLGQWVYGSLDPARLSAGGIESGLLMGALARALGWALIGLAVGAAQGITRASARTAALGAAGGFLAGCCGGCVFEALELLTSNPPIARLVGFVFLGTSIGFFTEAAPIAFKRAWLKSERGLRVGAEYLLDRRLSSVGSGPYMDVSLGRSRAASVLLYKIEVGKSFARLIPAPAATHAALRVNGDTIDSDTLLRSGDRIEILGEAVRFYSKGAAAIRPDELQGTRPALRRLVGVSGTYEGAEFPLSEYSVTIGRGRDQLVSLSRDKAVSRRHAVILEIGENYTIEDIGSANGTFLNSVPLSAHLPQRLNPGDTIKVGDSLLRFDA